MTLSLNRKHRRTLITVIVISALCVSCGGTKSAGPADSPEVKLLNAELEARMQKNPNLLPIEAFSGLPFATDVRLSPDGTYISFLKNQGTETGLVTINLSNNTPNGVIKADTRDMQFRWYEWVSEQHIIFSMVYFADDSSLNYKKTRLFRAVPDGTEDYRVIVDPKFDNVGITTNNTEHVSQFQDNVIDFLPSDPEHVLLSADFEEPLFPGVYELDVTNGNRHLIKSHKRPIKQWVTDQQGKVRIGIGINENYDTHTINLYDLQEKEWKQAWRFKSYSDGTTWPLGFGVDPNVLYVRAYHKDKLAVFKVDLTKPEYPQTLVAADPRYDISGSLIYSPKTNDVIGVYHSVSQDVRIYFDEEYKSFYSSVNRALASSTNYIVDFSQDENLYIVFATSETMPGTYLLGNKQEKTLMKLFETYPLLTKDKLSETNKLTYKARDGIEIEAYLTLPGGEQKGPFPTIVFPHGGPTSRDYGGFDYWKAFFVNRGYAVFQPNFRGSEGYGREFELASFQGFGQEMQDDITDGVTWLKEQGTAHPDKICIVGGSYGGYAALMGAVKTPDLFQCAVSFAGISDLKALREEHRYYEGYKAVREQIGTDNDMLKTNSPRRRTDEIKIPILLVHGEDDVSVSVKQSRAMASALKKSGKTYKYVACVIG